MTKMEKDAKRWKQIVDRTGIHRSYILKQTGLKEKEIIAFFEMAEDIGKTEGFDYEKIYATLKQFFASELTVGNFKYIDDDELSAMNLMKSNLYNKPFDIRFLNTKGATLWQDP